MRLAGFLAFSSALLNAQTGVVKFGSQPIPGASVVASQGDRRTVTTTDESGRYEFPELAVGAYALEVRMFGFQPARRQVQMGAGSQPVEWNLELLPRPVAQQARGNQPAPQDSFRNVMEDQEQNDPTLASPPSPNISDGSNEAFLVNGTVSNGLQNNQNDFGLRGPFMDMQAGFGGLPGLNGQPGTDGQQQAAQPGQGGPGGRFGGPGGPGGRGGFAGGGFGGGGRGGFGGGGRGGPGGRGGRGGDRPGGNGTFLGNRANRGRQGINGQASFTLTNSALNARPFSLTGQDVPQAAYAQTRASINVGGPLRIPRIWEKDSTFFFISYFLTRQKNPYKNVATVPTLAERSGDFSQSLANGAVSIFDPQTHSPFDGNRIPASLMDKAAQGLLNFFPLPNQPGGVLNYQILTSVPQDTDNLGIRLNQNLTRTDRLALNLNLQRRSSDPSQLFGFRDNTSGSGVNANVSYTKNLSRRTLSVFSVSFNRNRNDTLPYFAYKTDVASQLGIRGTSTDPINYGPPNLSFTNFGGLTDASPVLSRIQSTGASETVSMTKGTHNLSGGISFRRQQLNVQTDSNARGTFAFTGLATSAFDSAGNPIPSTGFNLADFLLDRHR